LDQALDQVACGSFDVAILDINLRGHAAHGVADQLKRTGIPLYSPQGTALLGSPPDLPM
jgi:CheY-like chemotaxis protein